MRQLLLLAVFMLTVTWAFAQQPGPSQPPSGKQTPSPSAPTTPGPSTTPGSAGQPQTGAEPGAQSQASNVPITEGCLAGSNPDFTITDKSGTTYKLNFSPGQNPAVLTSHVGESVQVAGEVKDAGGAGKGSSIEVHQIGKGSGN